MLRMHVGPARGATPFRAAWSVKCSGTPCGCHSLLFWTLWTIQALFQLLGIVTPLIMLVLYSIFFFHSLLKPVLQCPPLLHFPLQVILHSLPLLCHAAQRLLEFLDRLISLLQVLTLHTMLNVQVLQLLFQVSDLRLHIQDLLRQFQDALFVFFLFGI